MKYIAAFLAIVCVSLIGVEAKSDPQTCVGCKKLVELLSNITHSPEYKDDLVKLCDEYSLLPGKQAQAWCKKAVDRFYDLINNNMNLENVCYDIKACTRLSSLAYLHRVVLSSVNEVEDNNPNDCDFCLFVTQKIKDILVGGPTELEVKTHIEDVCHIFTAFEKQCTEIMNEYFDTIFTYLNETFQPRDLCQSFRMCSSAQKQNIVLNGKQAESRQRWDSLEKWTAQPNAAVQSFTPLPAKSDPMSCAICKRLVKIIQRQLKDNATDQQIINVLTEVCELFPHSERASCHQEVKDYADKLIEALTKDIDANLACAIAGLCVPSRFVNYLNGYYLQRKPAIHKGNVLCEECELIAHFIQNEMYNFKNEEQVETFIKNVMCKQLSYFIKEKDCDTFVNDYTPLIMQLIAQQVFEPTRFCFKEIKVCNQTGVKSRSFANCQMCQKLVNRVASLPTSNAVVPVETITETVCQHMSKPARVECALMMKAFGSYFAQSLSREETARDICRSLDLCTIPGHVHLLGGHKCTYGPSYWCHTEQHASACQASDYCNKNVWASSD